MSNYFLYTIISLPEHSNTIISLAYQSGVNGSTIINGVGTLKNKFLKFWGFENLEKEIILLIAKKNIGDLAIKRITDKIDVNKKNKGIIFKIKINEIHGIYESDLSENGEKSKDDNMQNKVVIAIVDKDLGNEVVECANSFGAKGATIIKGHGGGKNNITKFFNFEIEPEKDIVMMVLDNSIKNSVVNGINEKMQIKDPNKGIVFVLDAVEAFGLSK